MERRLAAIMFVDIVGYTALMAESEAKGLRVRERHRAVVGPLVAKYHGEAVEASGDESLAVFPTALDAVNCALAIQRQLAGDAELQLHIGIHLGDFVVERGEISGDAVNIAARICSFATSGVCVSGEVYHAVRNQPNIEAKPLGEHELKNVGRPVSVYALTGEPAAPAAAMRRAHLRSLVLAVIGTAVVLALGWWALERGAVSTDPIRSLAVLPLENLSGDPGQEYFADGMTEELIGALAKLGELRVISRTSVMQYKRERKPLPEIARELDVDGIVEGTVTRADDRVRITTQLIDARNDHHLWSERYDRALTDVLALQSEIARAVAEQVRAELAPAAQATRLESRTVDPRAYDAFLRGLEVRAAQPLGLVWAPRAIAEFERAVEIDPDFAEGWAALAHARATLSWTWDPLRLDEFPKAREAAERALEIDDRIGAAHASLGFVSLGQDWNFEAARLAYERAVEVAPSDPAVLEPYILYLLMVKRTEEALALNERLLRVAPFDRFYRASRVRAFWLARQYERALEEIERIRERHPDFAEIEVPMLYLTLGRIEEARRAFLDLAEQCGPACEWFRDAAERAPREAGGRAYLRSIAETAGKREGYSPFGIAPFYAGIGDNEQALAWLERGYRERDPLMTLLDTYPLFDPLRSDPRFQDLRRRIGFPETER